MTSLFAHQGSHTHIIVHTDSSPTYWILTPVYNDWASFELLLKQIKSAIEGTELAALQVMAVNDGSSLPIPSTFDTSGVPVHVLDLHKNMGHQKALALGVAVLAHEFDTLGVFTIDSDGEDVPAYINDLLAAAKAKPGHIVFAQRKRRTESWQFKLFYHIYKYIFKLLTGKTISFGNFAYLPKESVRSLSYNSDIFNHFSGGIIKSRLPYTTVPLDRGKRLAGKSQMNFYSLVLHGLSSVSVHIETVSVRLLVFSLVLMSMGAMAILAVLYLKLFTDKASPGWTTTVVFGAASLIFQTFLIAFLMVFVTLNNRTGRSFVPAVDYKIYIRNLFRL